MESKNPAPRTVDEYLAPFPSATRERLQLLRDFLRKAAPEAVEAIRYGIPTLIQQGNLVHFAGYAGHLGFYPGPSGIEAFRAELSAWPLSKGAIRFPLDGELPLDLIRRIVAFRIRENLAKTRARQERKAGRSSTRQG